MLVWQPCCKCGHYTCRYRIKWILKHFGTELFKCCCRCESSLGNKRKWVSLPLEEVSRDEGAKTSGGGPTRSDTEPNSDSSDPTSPSHTLHNNRAHDSSRSKWLVVVLCSCLLSLLHLNFASSHSGLALLSLCLLTTFPNYHVLFSIIKHGNIHAWPNLNLEWNLIANIYTLLPLWKR